MGDKGSVGMLIKRKFAVKIGSRIHGYVVTNTEKEALTLARKLAKRKGHINMLAVTVYYLPELSSGRDLPPGVDLT